MRELHNHGGQILDRVAKRESMTITRDGIIVALIAPLPNARLTAEALVER